MNIQHTKKMYSREMIYVAMQLRQNKPNDIKSLILSGKQDPSTKTCRNFQNREYTCPRNRKN